MLKTKYVTIEDYFSVVDVAKHCNYPKLDIAIDEALNFELPEILCEYYQIVLDAFEAEEPTEEQLKILNGDTFQCGRTTKKFLGAKKLLVYYSFANYLLNSHLHDTGLGFKQKTDQYSIPTPIKDIKEHTNKYRNMGYAIVKQLKEYLCHLPEIQFQYGLNLMCDCGCSSGDCDFTEKRIYKFKPKVIKKRL